MAKVFALVNRKGGTGKTTSAVYIAQLFHLDGGVTGIDLDPDQSWLKWYRSGNLPYLVVPGSRDDLHEQLEAIQTPYVVIDTPPNDEAIIFKAAGIADEVIIPLAATSLDVGRLLTTLKNVADVEKLRKQALASILLTRWQPNLKVAKETLTTIQERDLPLLDAKIGNRTRYTEFSEPHELDEYRRVLVELGALNA